MTGIRPRIFPGIYAALLIALLFGSASYSEKHIAGLPTIAFGCDLFGHLANLKELRSSWREKRAPHFIFDSRQTRELIEFIKGEKPPLTVWEQMVGPHASHYVPSSDLVIDQYPPGTAIALAAFPEGQEIASMSRYTVEFVLFFGIAAILFGCFWRSAYFSSGLIALGCFELFDILVKYGLGNPSVFAILLPSAFTSLFVVWSRSSRDGRLAAATAGTLAGISCLIRLPGALQIPGLASALNRRARAVFLVAFTISGVLPIAWLQNQATGSWWRSTYGAEDTHLPILHVVWSYFRFYLVNWREGATYFLLPVVVGIAFSLWLRKRPADLAARAIRRSALWSLAIPVVFFISHHPPVAYYLIPAEVTFTWLLAGGAYFIETGESPKTRGVFPLLPLLPLLALALLAEPPIKALLPAKEKASLAFVSPWNVGEFRKERIPSELRESSAWIWSDLTNGAFWYYADKPAFKIGFGGTPELRADILRWVERRGEPQYLIMDGENSEMIAREVHGLGARLEERGRVFGFPYFRIAFYANTRGK